MSQALVLRTEEHAAWSSTKMGKSTLYSSPHMLVGLNAFEPGQEHALHAHTGMDKVYQVLSGRGLLLLQDRQVAIEPGMTVVAPGDVPHGLRNTGDERLLVLAVLAPGGK